jgi:uncharacterized protein YndB with AHSA1/START domain
MTTSPTSPTSPLGVREGDDLTFTRTFRAPRAAVWAACTDPERMQRWIGTWSGDPASGEVVFRMTAEGDDVPEEVYLVEACEPPHRFVVTSRDAQPFSDDGTGELVRWRLALDLQEVDGVTTLRFTQDVPPGEVGVQMVGNVGPGWDYYLDRLATDLDGGDVESVVFEPYLERSAYYRGLFG